MVFVDIVAIKHLFESNHNKSFNKVKWFCKCIRNGHHSHHQSENSQKKNNKETSCTECHAKTSCKLLTFFFYFNHFHTRTWETKNIRFWIENFTAMWFWIKFSRLVRFRNKSSKTCQILTWRKHNASDFDLKVLQSVTFWNIIIPTCQILKKKFSSKYHVLAHFTPWKRHIWHFLFFLRSMILNWKHYNASHSELIEKQCVRFWIENFKTRQNLI